jgi:ribosomal protein S18 acetylase RimI-like enzyme
MNIFLLNKSRRAAYRRPSNITVYHNIDFPLDDVLDIFYALFGSSYPIIDLLRMISTANHMFCAYDQQGQCLACALLDESTEDGGIYLTLFGVRQSSQGAGVGTYLLKTIVRWARRSGYVSIYLHVHSENHRAIGLYEKVGFRKRQFLPDFYRGTSKRPRHGFLMMLEFYSNY